MGEVVAELYSYTFILGIATLAKAARWSEREPETH